VNKDHFKGDLSEKDAPMEFLCEGFKDMPSPCEYYNDRIIFIPNEKKNYEGSKHQALYVFVTLLVIFALLLIVFFWRKWMLNRMNKEVYE